MTHANDIDIDLGTKSFDLDKAIRKATKAKDPVKAQKIFWQLVSDDSPDGSMII